MKQSLALVILTKNQNHLAQEIIKKSGSDFDSIYVLDDYSDDDISQIAKIKNVYFFQHTLANSFAAHRNWILKQVKEDWAFFLDADEEISAELATEIRQSIETTTLLAFRVPRLDVFAGTVLHFGEVANISLTRLGRSSRGKWERAVHETWEFPDGTVGVLRTPLLHYAHSNITSFLSKLHRYAVLEKSERMNRGRWRIVAEMWVYPSSKFVQNYVLRQGFRDGFAGFVYAFLMSYYSLIKRVIWYEDLT